MISLAWEWNLAFSAVFFARNSLRISRRVSSMTSIFELSFMLFLSSGKIYVKYSSSSNWMALDNAAKVLKIAVRTFEFFVAESSFSSF